MNYMQRIEESPAWHRLSERFVLDPENESRTVELNSINIYAMEQEAKDGIIFIN